MIVMAPNKVPANIGAKASPGRPKGSPNKTTALLKDAILMAAEAAGGEGDDKEPGGLVGYLTKQAKDEPVAFMSMLGKVLPLQITGAGGGPVELSVSGLMERIAQHGKRIVDPGESGPVS